MNRWGIRGNVAMERKSRKTKKGEIFFISGADETAGIEEEKEREREGREYI